MFYHSWALTTIDAMLDPRTQQRLEFGLEKSRLHGNVSISTIVDIAG